MSDPQEAVPNELAETLSTLQREFQSEISRTQQEKLRLSAAVPGRQKTAEEHLTRARAFYKRKEWARAFSEWDAVCAFLSDGDEFRKKIALLRESHDNLAGVHRELAEIKEILSKRSAPSAEEKKFVQDAHEAATGQVKQAYAHLSRELRTERTPKTLSFWWPVAAALLVLCLGFLGLTARQTRSRIRLRQQVEASAQDTRLTLVALQTERDDLLKKLGALQEDYNKKVAELKGQNEGWRNAGREKIEELEVQLKEAELKNKELDKKIGERDRLIRTLTSR